MIKYLSALLAVLVLLFAVQAKAITMPVLNRWYFVGNTAELYRIRAGIAHIAGYPATSYTSPWGENSNYGVLGDHPFGMGEVDCMNASYYPNQGPYDGAEDYLGMSTTVIENGQVVGVEIPMLEDLVFESDEDFPGECFGYLFHAWCGTEAAVYMCPDPEPAGDGGV